MGLDAAWDEQTHYKYDEKRISKLKCKSTPSFLSFYSVIKMSQSKGFGKKRKEDNWTLGVLVHQRIRINDSQKIANFLDWNRSLPTQEYLSAERNDNQNAFVFAGCRNSGKQNKQTRKQTNKQKKNKTKLKKNSVIQSINHWLEPLKTT